MSCNSITKKGNQCTKPRLPLSKYCIFHQDLTIGVIGAILGVIATVVVGLWQDKEPNLTMQCQIDESGDPSKLKCLLYNSGRAEARDVIVSFNNLIPLETDLICNPELGIGLEEVSPPPNPLENPLSSKLMTAFIVRIPRVSAKNRIVFSVVTTNTDNKRAAKQTMRIRKHIENVVNDFYGRISRKYPHEIKNGIINNFFIGRIKNHNFFKPEKFSYEKGIFEVDFINKEEKIALAISQELLKKYKKEFISVFKGRPMFKAPVLRIKTRSGPMTLGLFPQYISTYSTVEVPVSELKEKGSTSFPIPVPQSYD